MTKAKVLVTGAAGFIGSHVCDALLASGHEVVGLDDLSGGFRENLPDETEFVEASILDAGRVQALFDERGFEHVVHCAAYAAEGLSHFIKGYNYANNLLGSVNLINAAVNTGTVRCLAFTSSIAVYGRGQVPMDEDLVPQPEDPYGIAKYAVELDLREAHEMFGLNSVVFRPHNVYGERQNLGDPYRNVIGIFMSQIRQDRPMTLFGDGAQTRAFSYISDVAPLIAASLERPAAWNRVFNVGADTPVAVKDLAVAVARAMGVEPRVEHLPARNEVIDAWSRHDRAREVFGDLMHNVPLEEGLARMAAWAREAPLRPGQIFERVEVERQLPPSWKRYLKQPEAASGETES